MTYPKVKHKEWIQHCNIESVMRLSKTQKIPDSIEGFMLVAACKHVLRCVYGSNLHAAFSLFCSALWDKILYPWRYADYLLHRKRWQDEEVAEEIKEIEEEIKEANE